MKPSAKIQDDGFGALWTLVTSEAIRRMRSAQESAVLAFIEANPDLENAGLVARELGLETPCLKALEAGVACRETIFRMANARSSAAAITLESNIPVSGLASIITDALRIYLSAYIDACKKFCEAAMGQLVPEDEATRACRETTKNWAAAAKKLLSTGRETVAHGDTAYIAGINEDGLWPILLIHDAATEEWLLATFRDGVKTDQERFEWRVEQLIKTAILAVDQGEAQMRATSNLIRGKLSLAP